MADRQLRGHANGHVSVGGLRALYGNYAAYGARAADQALPGLTPDDARFTPLFPDTTLIARGTVMRIDTVVPLSPDRSLVESRGIGIAGESDRERRMRIGHHNDYWGPLGRNVPEDAFAAEACAAAFGPGAALFQTIAREEQGGGQDDCGLRSFYAEWSRRLGRPAHAPVNDRP
jgi:methanesulfonate monooxygenase large subunit